MLRSAALLAIGDELLSGLRHDTNCSWLAARLHDAGVPVRGIQVLPDQDEPILDDFPMLVLYRPDEEEQQ